MDKALCVAEKTSEITITHRPTRVMSAKVNPISRSKSTDTIFIQHLGCKRPCWLFWRSFCCRSTNWNEVVFVNESKNNVLFLYGRDVGSNGLDNWNSQTKQSRFHLLNLPLFNFSTQTEGVDVRNDDNKGDEEKIPDFKEIDGCLMQILRPGEKSKNCEVAQKAIIKMYVQKDDGSWVYGFKKKFNTSLFHTL